MKSVRLVDTDWPLLFKPVAPIVHVYLSPSVISLRRIFYLKESPPIAGYRGQSSDFGARNAEGVNHLGHRKESFRVKGIRRQLKP